MISLGWTNVLKQINLNFDKTKLMKFITNNKIYINANRDYSNKTKQQLQLDWGEKKQ